MTSIVAKEHLGEWRATRWTETQHMTLSVWRGAKSDVDKQYNTI